MKCKKIRYKSPLSGSLSKNEFKSSLKIIRTLIRIIFLAIVFNFVLSDITLADSTSNKVKKTMIKPMAVAMKNDTLQKILEKYSKASSIQSDIKKTDEKVILGSKAETQGVFKIQKDKIYILQNNDKKTEVYFLNKTLTLVEYPDADFLSDSDLKGATNASTNKKNSETQAQGKRKVTILKKAMPPLINNLLNLFSSPKNFNNEFSILSQKPDGDFETIELKSLQKNIKNLSLKIDKKNLELLELSFTDDVDTKTTLLFTNLKLNISMKKNEFQYRPLNSDEVIIE